MAGAGRMRGGFRRLRADWDYDKVGSAPLCGIDGAVLVGHGRANTEDVASGIRSVRSVVEAGVVDAIRDAVAGTAPVNDEDPEDAPPSSQRDGQVSDTWRYERR